MKEKIFTRDIQKCPFCNQFWNKHSPELIGQEASIWFCKKGSKYIVEVIDYRVHVSFDTYDSANEFIDKWYKSKKSYGDISKIIGGIK